MVSHFLIRDINHKEWGNEEKRSFSLWISQETGEAMMLFHTIRRKRAWKCVALAWKMRASCRYAALFFSSSMVEKRRQFRITACSWGSKRKELELSMRNRMGSIGRISCFKWMQTWRQPTKTPSSLFIWKIPVILFLDGEVHTVYLTPSVNHF